MKKATNLRIGSPLPVTEEKSKSQGNFMNRKKNCIATHSFKATLLKSERERYKLYNNGLVNQHHNSGLIGLHCLAQ